MIGPVVDCSVTTAWFLRDERSTEADAALDRVTAVSGVAPWLWWAEIRNVFLIAERNGRMTAADTATALTELLALGIRLDLAPDSATATSQALRTRTRGLCRSTAAADVPPWLGRVPPAQVRSGSELSALSPDTRSP